MINLHNYAILAEQKKYGYSTPITESIDAVNEAGPDMQTADGLNKVMSGKTDPNYTAQWNQLVDDIAARKKLAGTYKVTIKHDDNKDMVTLEYQIGTDGKPIKTSVKLAAVSGATSGSGSSSTIDINKIKSYKPGAQKMKEFVAALITVSIEKYGKTWGANHINWITNEINGLKDFGSYSGLAGYITPNSTQSLSFLIGKGDVSKPITSLTGGDDDAVLGVTADASLRLAGSAASSEKLNKVLVAISGKLGETMISNSDDTSLVALYQLISVGYGSGQIGTAWNALGKAGGLLSSIIDVIDSNYSTSLMIWAIGVRGLTATNEASIKKTGFDSASYTESVAKIKAALI